jgi:epoxyqueuosine reductase QueG
MREYKINYEVANLKLNSIAWGIARFLEEQGFQALAIPASQPYDVDTKMGDMSNKHAAVAAGLGKFGLNNLVLTPSLGPYVRFATIVTNANLKPDKTLKQDICLGEKCAKCIRACPPKALEKFRYNPTEGWPINKEKCHQYLHVVSNGDICGLCIKACPIGDRRKSSPD